MFSGIVEAQVPVLAVQSRTSGIELRLERPENFVDVHTGDSIAVNGVCLTVEALDPKSLVFTLGLETLKVTGWDPNHLSRLSMNLERSLKMGERLHGHIVSGHVDSVAKILAVEDLDGWRRLVISLTPEMRPMIWLKGSIAVQGVSLTVNLVHADRFEVGLIPETLRRTNLGSLKAGDPVNLEADQMARGLIHWLSIHPGPQWN